MENSNLTNQDGGPGAEQFLTHEVTSAVPGMSEQSMETHQSEKTRSAARYAGLSGRGRLLNMLRLLLRSQLMRHAERKQVVNDAHLLRDLQSALPHLDMETLHRGLQLLMEDDARAGRPYIAALASAHRNDQPWPGFIPASQQLQRKAQPTGAQACETEHWRQAVTEAYRFYGEAKCGALRDS